MTRFLILHYALVGALLGLVAMTPAVSGAAIVVPGADTVALAKTGSGGGNLYYAKDDGFMHVDRARRAVGGSKIYASIAKDDSDALKGKSGKSGSRDDIKTGNEPRVDSVRLAAAGGGDEFHAKEAFTKDDSKARLGHIKAGSDDGNDLAGRIKAGIIKAGSVVAGV
ncbi:hypothetical protein GGF31_002076 [Allomyces arbusculus]|nr:hypothetical protein GGF31_002076 [Allomyces arbusculus]